MQQRLARGYNEIEQISKIFNSCFYLDLIWLTSTTWVATLTTRRSTSNNPTLTPHNPTLTPHNPTLTLHNPTLTPHNPKMTARIGSQKGQHLGLIACPLAAPRFQLSSARRRGNSRRQSSKRTTGEIMHKLIDWSLIFL